MGGDRLEEGCHPPPPLPMPMSAFSTAMSWPEAFLPFPSWNSRVQTEVSEEEVRLDVECGTVDGFIYDPEADVPFQVAKLRKTLNKIREWKNIKRFPVPLLPSSSNSLFPDPFFTGEDILRKYGRELDLSGYDYMDRELRKWEEFERSPLEILILTDKELKKMWKLSEASALRSTRDDPEFLGNCFDVAVAESEDEFTALIGDGRMCGRLSVARYKLDDSLGSSRMLRTDLTASGRVKFQDMVCQVGLIPQLDSAVCRSETGIFVCSVPKILNSATSSVSTHFLWKFGTFRHFCLSHHVPEDVCVIGEDGNISWGQIGGGLFSDQARVDKCDREILNCTWSDHPRTLFITTADSVGIVDLRSMSAHQSAFFESTAKERIEALGKPVFDCVFPVLTNKRILLVDERRRDQALQAWNHSLVGGLKFLSSSCFSMDDLILTATQRLLNDTVAIGAQRTTVETMSERLAHIVGKEPPRRELSTADVLLWLKCRTGSSSPSESVIRRVRAPIRGSILLGLEGRTFLFTSNDCGDLYYQCLSSTEADSEELDNDFLMGWKNHLEGLSQVCPDNVYGTKTNFRPVFSTVDVSGLLSDVDSKRTKRHKELPTDRMFGGKMEKVSSTNVSCDSCDKLGATGGRIKEGRPVSDVKVKSENATDLVSKLILDVWNED